jgi:hypothetical protein
MTNNALAIAVTTRVENPRPTTTGVKNGVDYDAEVMVTDEAGITSRWSGEVTYAPAQADGSLVPYGPSVEHWMSGSLIKAINEPWIVAHGKLVKAITKSLGGGEGIESFDVML